MKESVASLYHPFVIQIAQGTLSKDKFKEYMNQDEYFLNVFNNCMKLGELKCDIADTHCIQLLRKLKGEHETELKLHEDILSNKGTHVIINPAAKHYTENLLRVAFQEARLGYLAAALMPCPVLYKYIGQNIAVGSKFKTEVGFDENLRKWIETYSCDGYESSHAEQLLNHSGAGLAYHKLLHYYKQSMVLEYLFFDAYDVDDDCCLPFAQRFCDKQIALILDFDKTMTKFDTCDIIGEGVVHLHNQRSKSNAQEQWDDFVCRYFTGYQKTAMAMTNAESLDKCCMILDDYEHEGKKMVSDSKFLGGIKVSELRSLGKWVQLHKGCPELIEKSSKFSNVHVKVMSANWSSEFINAVIEENIGDNSSNVEVISNDLHLDDDCVTTGVIDGSVCGPKDKEDKIGKITRDGVMTVFVGDSVHDLLALLAADIGIIFGSNELLREICLKFNISVLPLITYMINPSCKKVGERNVLFTVDNYYEIIAFMYGIKKEEMVYSMFPESSISKVLVIGGSDSAGCSGIQADIKTCDACGVYVSSAVTSVTIQNTRGVHHIDNMDARSVELQMISVLSDLGVDVVKTGMLPTPEIVDAVVKVVKRFDLPCLVVDPVFKSSTGTNLITEDAKTAIIRKLFPLSSIITPNVHEASVILNDRPINDIDDMRKAARDIQKLGPSWVLIKGGHIPSPGNLVYDVLYNGDTDIFYEFNNPGVHTRNSRGTGCTLASAIASNLALGRMMVEAIEFAHSYVYDTLLYSSSHTLGKPSKSGPMLHNFESQKRIKVEGLRSKLGLYFVTDQAMIDSRQSTIGTVVKEAILGGATFIQIRCKNTNADEFCKYVNEALNICRRHNVPLVVNDRIDVAMACNADGVHVGQTDLDMRSVRHMLGPNKIIGVSASSVWEAIRAQQDGANYIGAGSVFSTSTKYDIDDEIGLENLKSIVDAVDIPVVAIGGITYENTPEVMLCGVDGIAVVSAILKGDSVESNSRELWRIVQKGLKPPPSLNILVSQSACKIEIINRVYFLLDIDKMLMEEACGSLVLLCREAVSHGASIIVVKCDSQDGRPFCNHVRNILETFPDISVIVKDRIDVALLSGAHGVLLDNNSLDIQSSRKLLGPHKVIGMNVNCGADAKMVAKADADFIIAQKNIISDVLGNVMIPVVANDVKFTEEASKLKQDGARGFMVLSEAFQDETFYNLIGELKLLLNN